ncbi:MAG: hypothetical protein K6A65_03315 [Succinivibrionaceae bacterium]|nr:hypothetical protein [Succinivibrionaceae bacterium]
MPNQVSGTSSSFDSFARLADTIKGLDGRKRVEINDGGLAASGLKRHFLSIGSWGRDNRSLTQSTQATARLLRETMVNKFGAKVGNWLFSRSISNRQVTGESSIRAADVRRLLGEAVEASRFYSARALGDSSDGKFHGIELAQVMGQASRATGTKFGPYLRHCLAKAQALLETTPHDLLPLAHHRQSLQEVAAELQRARETLEGLDLSGTPDSARARDELLGKVGHMAGMAVSRAAQLQAEINEFPTQGQGFGQYLDLVVKSAKDLAEGLKSDPAFQGERQGLDLARQRLGDLQEKYYQEHHAAGTVSPKQLGFLKELSAECAKIVASSINRPGAAGDFLGRIRKGMIGNLERLPWDTIRRDLTFVLAGRTVNATSIMVPAVNINGIGESMRAEGINGVAASDQGRANHGVNIWGTELRSGGKLLYRGVRHGVNCAYEIRNPQARREANKVRAREVVTAAFTQHPDFQNLLNRARSGEVIHLPMASIALLTPDPIRSAFSAASGERAQLRGQLEAWQSLEQEGCQITIKDGDQDLKVSIKPTVLCFNYGVNEGAQYNLLQPIAGWGYSNDLNKRSLLKLVGQGKGVGGIAQERAQALQETDPATARKITLLASQIKELQSGGGYAVSGEDPFRLPARINLLCHLCGITPCFNCKSGKDRTGQMDNAVKELALSLEYNPGGVGLRTHDRKDRVEAIRTLAMGGGGLEVTRLNTALRGYKITGVEGTLSLFGPQGVGAFQGLSMYTDK